MQFSITEQAAVVTTIRILSLLIYVDARQVLECLKNSKAETCWKVILGLIRARLEGPMPGFYLSRFHLDKTSEVTSGIYSFKERQERNVFFQPCFCFAKWPFCSLEGVLAWGLKGEGVRAICHHMDFSCVCF